jgi:hypothetical protein
VIRKPGLLRWLIPVAVALLLFVGAYVALLVVGFAIAGTPGD